MFPPDLLPGADEMISAFWELSTDRQIGMQAGQIPFSAIDAWARRAGIVDQDEFEELCGCIRALDVVWLDNGKTPPADAGPKVSARPMSPALFDALF